MTWGDTLTALGVLVAAGIGGWGIRQAGQANKHANRSTEIADEALAVSKRADERADRLEQLATERKDIDWKLDWIEDSDTISARNIGTDTAYNVELTVDTTKPSGFPRQRETRESVAGGEAIGYRYPSSTTQQARSSFEQTLRDLSAGGIHIAGGSAMAAAAVNALARAGL